MRGAKAPTLFVGKTANDCHAYASNYRSDRAADDGT
jgi:hypothetical protein